LETQGLIAVRRRADDARARRVHLTAKGCREFAAYDSLSDRLAQSILAPLSPGQRERLVAAMGEVARLIRTATVEVRVAQPDSDDARWCLAQYFGEISERFESGFDPHQGGAADDAEMQPPTGFFVVAWLDGEPVGCGGMKRLDATTGEIKRVWTARCARGQGVARRIMQTLETLAQASGVTTIRLDTNESLTEAQAMYRRSGYTEIARYNDNPYAHHWFEKQLLA
jgi:ribosomal protein S18 acetylase RimI-like enzyme